jgi:glycosyltransferase involved in cell wall biosynthesis
MKVSLLIGTTGKRRKQINKFLTCLTEQSYRDIEVIFVLQGAEQIADIIKPFKPSLDIKVKLTNEFGLSRARNIAGAISEGSIVAFPDDDCFYESDTIERVVQYFQNSTTDVVVGAIYDPHSLQGFFRYPQVARSMRIPDLWLAPSVSIFLKKSIFEHVEGFDEAFGLGGKYRSGDETDLLFRIVENSPATIFRIDPQIRVYHEIQKHNHPFYANRAARAFEIAAGRGALVRKHLRYMPFYWMSKWVSFLIRAFGGFLIYGFLRLDTKAMKYYLRSVAGLFIGFSSYKGNTRHVTHMRSYQ